MPELLFVTVPERKTEKNRLHFDLMPIVRTRDEEVDRLLAAGASLVDDRRGANGRGWVVLADPTNASRRCRGSEPAFAVHVARRTAGPLPALAQ
jgi:hypothetical protein